MSYRMVLGVQNRHLAEAKDQPFHVALRTASGDVAEGIIAEVVPGCDMIVLTDPAGGGGRCFISISSIEQIAPRWMPTEVKTDDDMS